MLPPSLMSKRTVARVLPSSGSVAAPGQAVEEVGRRVCHRPCLRHPSRGGSRAPRRPVAAFCPVGPEDAERGVSDASPDVHHTADGVNRRGVSGQARVAPDHEPSAVPRHGPQVTDDHVDVGAPIARSPTPMTVPDARRRGPRRSRSARPRTTTDRDGCRVQPCERERVAVRVGLAVHDVVRGHEDLAAGRSRTRPDEQSPGPGCLRSRSPHRPGGRLARRPRAPGSPRTSWSASSSSIRSMCERGRLVGAVDGDAATVARDGWP